MRNGMKYFTNKKTTGREDLSRIIYLPITKKVWWNNLLKNSKIIEIFMKKRNKLNMLMDLFQLTILMEKVIRMLKYHLIQKEDNLNLMIMRKNCFKSINKKMRNRVVGCQRRIKTIIEIKTK